MLHLSHDVFCVLSIAADAGVQVVDVSQDKDVTVGTRLFPVLSVMKVSVVYLSFESGAMPKLQTLTLVSAGKIEEALHQSGSR